MNQAGHRHWQQGVAHLQQRRWSQAASAFERATRAAPRDALSWVNLAHARRHAGALEDSLAAARRALQIEPASAVARRIEADVLLQLHRHAEAAESLSALHSHGSDAGEDDPDALVQHAAALQALQRPAEAVPLLLRALGARPAHVRAHALLADALRDQGLKREAVECMKTVLALDPGNLEAMSHLSFEKRHLCDWRDFDADLQALQGTLATAPAGLARVAAAFGLLSLPLEPELQLAAARGESLVYTTGVVPLQPCTGHGRIRLGLLSYDFREHPVSQLLVEVLEAIDRSRFDVLLYSAGPDDGSVLRQRLQATATAFTDLRGLSDDAAARRIRADGVEVLLDLMGHTRGHRMGILARRPAPVQAAYLGYPGSTGAEFIDYLVGDPLLTPLDLAPQFSEKLAQLPLTFQPNGRSRPRPMPAARSDHGLPEGAFVMCAFNHTYKIGPEAFDAWCAAMHAVPHAVLWLKRTNPQLHDNVHREAAARGIDPARVVWAPALPWQQHFSRLALADVFVDTWPYNAHTTAADALWAGVPVVTKYGNGFASRVAASVLNAAGLGELAFGTVDEYLRAIVALAHDDALRGTYRRYLNERRFELPLFDTARYAVELQALLERMAERARAGLAPAHLPA